MNKKTIIIYIYIFTVAVLCILFFVKFHKQESASSPLNQHVSIIRLEQKLFKCKSKEEIALVLDKNPDVVEKLLKLRNNEGLEEVVDRMYSMIHNPRMQELYNEVQLHFCDVEQIESELSQAFSSINQHYPKAKFPKIITMITGMEVEFYIDNDLIVIGLDYFLGPESKYKLCDVPKYLLNTYTYNDIVPKILLLYAREYLAIDPIDTTLLAAMIAYGKIFFFVKSILPTIEDRVLLGYTNEQLCDVEENQGVIWDFFIDKKLLFSTNSFNNSMFLDEREFTSEIYPTCPGAIARWLGYVIVKSYMKQNPAITLIELLNTQDAQFIFENSKYRPYK
jgi:hypothetical protein